jgi:hypothetical protein
MSLPGALLLAASVSAHVPFVGCPADGQVGPIDAPRPQPMPAVPRAAAAALAWYVSREAAVLAPRGWHCFEVYGSDGYWLFVAPEALRYDRLRADGPGLRGPVVVLSYAYGGTSGRWMVADHIARYFPRYRGFIRQIREMGLQFDAVPTGPYPGDRILSRTATRIRLVTPAGARGEGSTAFLAPSPLPTESLIMLDPASEMDATTVRVRLPRSQAGLGAAILAGARRGFPAPTAH